MANEEVKKPQFNNGNKQNQNQNTQNKGPKVENSKNSSTPNQQGNAGQKANPDNKAMIAKVNQQMSSEEDESLVARAIGLGLVILGIIFIILAIVVVVLSRREPKVDSSLEKPTITVENEFTNAEEVVVKGEAKSDVEVIYWVNGELQDSSVNAEGGKFEFKYEFSKEGDYTFEAAIVEGFPIRKRSDKSESVKVTVDWTRPSDDAKLEYDGESTDGLFNLKGETEPYSTVILRDKVSGEESKVEADKDGKFSFDGLVLSSDSTEFEVVIRDRSGNERVLSETIVVTVVESSENGGTVGSGTTTGNGTGTNTGTTGGKAGDLPESSGELEAAFEFIFGNKLMVAFGLIAFAVLVGNTGLVMYRLKR